MISLRQHAISLVAVFLALAVGIVVGSGFVAERVHSGADSGRVETLEQDKRTLEEQLRAAGAFDEALAPRVLKGQLTGRTVTIITTSDANSADVEGLRGHLTTAGAKSVTFVGITDKLTGGSDGERLRSIIDQSIPAGKTLRPELVDIGARTGDLLGLLLAGDPKTGREQATAAERNGALTALRDAGYLTFTGAAPVPAETTLLVTGGEIAASAGVGGRTVARLAAAYAPRSAGVVVAGATGSARGASAVATLRSDAALGGKLSTVDGVDTASGRLTAALAAIAEKDGRHGAYGTGPGATSATVPA